ncbi:MAG: hypothetical protein R3C03_22290 [Pirellulaceae bacterium]
MKLTLLAVAATLMFVAQANAQCSSCGTGTCGTVYSGGNVLGGGVSEDFTPPTCSASITGFPRRDQALRYAAHDHFSPHKIYAYSRNGITAQRVDEWNKAQGQAYPWHGEYNYWRWGAPTALVVPPTATYQTEYNWGVGQTQSLPIYHQFGYGNNGGSYGGGYGMYPNTPYWPSSTNQFGVYPVRGPWH